MRYTNWGTVLLKASLPTFTYLAGAGLKLFPKTDLQTFVLVTFAIFLVATLTEYRTLIIPTERWDNVVPFVADRLTDRFFHFVRERAGIEPRMNVMVPVRSACFIWLRRNFHVWWARGMDNQPDVGIKIRSGEGVVSECFKRKESVIADSKSLKLGHALCVSQQKLVKDLDVVVSVPIYEARIGAKNQSGRIIGVLNLDSKTPGAFKMLSNDPALLLQIKRDMEKIASVFGKIIV